MKWICHQPELEPLLRENYRPSDLEHIEAVLRRFRTLELRPRPSGIYCASNDGGLNPRSGYGRAWLRDNVYVAWSRWQLGDNVSAVHTARTLLRYLRRHLHRFDEILLGRADPDDPMQRPHVRFEPDTLAEVEEDWAHAQNDALGYVLWLCCSLVSAGLHQFDEAETEVLARFVPYFRAVQFWRDRDSGHWEEGRRLNSSSIGVVVAALEQLRRLQVDGFALRAPDGPVGVGNTDRLLELGRERLSRQLPDETPRSRGVDGALLFLLEPLQLVDGEIAGTILQRVRNELEGQIGIKRYRGDSYWCADYRKLLTPDRRSADFSMTVAERDLLFRPGTEAQWCIFDPLISVYHGRRFARNGEDAERELQVYHLNRALGQISGYGERVAPGQCPEAYFLDSSEEGVYRPNDQTPLAWTQANLAVALKLMRDTTI